MTSNPSPSASPSKLSYTQRLKNKHLLPNPNSVIIYGIAGSGKSTLALQALKTGRRLHYFDCENGSVLVDRLMETELAPYADNLFYYNMSESRTKPEVYRLIPRILSGRDVQICTTHFHVDCPICKLTKATEGQELWEVFNLNNLKPMEDIIVFDSMSQFSDSVRFSTDSSDDAKLTFDQWNSVGIKLASALTSIQFSKIPVIAIAHSEAVPDEDDKEKFFPTIGTRNFAPKTTKAFSHAIYTKIDNGKFLAISSSTFNPKIPAKSRNDLKLEQGKYTIVDMLLDVRPEITAQATTSTSKTEVKKGLGFKLKK
jgi:hypothetical protein